MIAINVHILTFNLIDQTYSRIIIWTSYFVTCSYLAIDIYNEWQDFRHKLVGIVTLCSMGINAFLFVLYYTLGFSEYKTKFFYFNGSVLAVSIMILISGNIHGHFKNKPTNE